MSQRSLDDAAMAMLHTLSVVCAMAELRDKHTGDHIDRMSRYAGILAVAAQEPDAHLIQLAARAHDIGKIAIADGLLFKPGVLTREEYEVMKAHAFLGHELLTQLEGQHPLMTIAAEIAWCHHEQWDGSGYPRGLVGEAIPRAARVASIADAWDAMTTDRVYRKALWAPDARAVIRKGAGHQFDPELSEVFLKLIDEGRV